MCKSKVGDEIGELLTKIQVESGDGIREVQPNKNWQLKGSRESGDEIGELQPNQKRKKNSTKFLELLDFRTCWEEI